MNLSIRELVTRLKGELILGDPRAIARRAVVDSRQIEKGDLFFALKGERTDGHLFAMSVANSGAAGVVVSHMEWLRSHKNLSCAAIQVENPLGALHQLCVGIRSDFNGMVIGVTGSNGKTATKQMVASVVSPLGPGLSTKGNLNSQVGLPLMMG